MSSTNLPKIINILNTNQITQDLNQTQSANNISIQKLQNLLAQNFTNIIGNPHNLNKKSTNLELLGQGINGTIYKINQPNQEYICKCIDHSKENIDQLEYEIELIKKLQSNEMAVRYVNPCIGVAITPEIIITIFPRFQATTLDNIIMTMTRQEFNTPQRISLIKYLIYQMILGLTEIHRLGICHRQINSGSVLIEVRPGDANQMINKSTQIWYSEDQIPLRVKYTNFGFGCLNTCLPMLSNIDPHQPNGPIDFLGSQKYDIWCLGLLFLKLLYDPQSKQLVSNELEKFLDVVNNHMLVSLDQRKSADYIKDTIAINDKLWDDLGSDGNSETYSVVEQFLSKLTK